MKSLLIFTFFVSLSIHAQVSYQSALQLAQSRASKMSGEITNSKIGNLTNGKRNYWFIAVYYDGGACLMSVPETKLEIVSSKCVNRYRIDELIEMFNEITEYIDPVEIKRIKQQEEIEKRRREEEEIRLLEENRKQQVIKDSISKILSFAELKFQNKEYNEAILLYENILALDSNHTYSKNKINQINEILKFLKERNLKTFDYSQLENLSYKKNINLIQDDVLKYINPVPKGDLKLDFYFSFDTLGVNRSTYKVEGSNSNYYRSQFENVVKQFSLPIPSQYGYYVNASIDNKYNISWATDEKLFRYTANGIKQLKGDITEIEIYQNYIKTMNYYGDFTIESKSIIVNNESFLNAKVTSYNSKAGPANVIYSLILPGVGTKKVTYGEKGTGRMVTFLISSAFAYSMKSYSNKKYDLYMNSMGDKSLEYYEQANKANKIFLTSVGLATSIYIYDIFYVIGKGVRNKKNQKEINSKIPNFKPVVYDNIILK